MDFTLTPEQQEFVMKNYRLVHYLVNKLRVSSSDYDDFVSIGTIGLCKAVATFNSDRKTSFSTYASRCIQNEIFMYLRKCNNQVLSLDDELFADSDGDTFTLNNLLYDKKHSSFDEQIADIMVICKVLNYILNCLPCKKAIIILLSIAGLNQYEISGIANFSQSYISRLETAIYSELKKYEMSDHYEEVFTMSIKDNQFELAFSTTDVKHFNQIFAKFLIGSDVQKLFNFKVHCNHERVTIYLPAEAESLVFVAQILQQIEDFGISFTSLSSDTSKKDVAVSAAKEKSDVTIQSEIDNNVSTSSEDSCTISSNHDDVIASNSEKDPVDSSLPVESSNEVVPSEVSTNVHSTVGVRQVREYMLTLSQFAVSDLKAKFPNATQSTLANAICLTKSKGLITQIDRGIYSVVNSSALSKT